jgi:hypothetical protein
VNILIAPTERFGRMLADRLNLSRETWMVRGFGFASMGSQFDTILIFEPDWQSLSRSEQEDYERWKRESLAHCIARSGLTLYLRDRYDYQR